MRRVEPPRRPWGWQTHVRDRGRRWLRRGDHRAAERPNDYWRQNGFGDKIGEAFDYICCYCAMYVPNGHADHFIPWRDLRGTGNAGLAYEWSNIRYSDGWLNQSKRAQFPDPFEVEDDWFELKMPSLELHKTDKVPSEQQTLVDNVLMRVGRDERVMKVRRRYYRQYSEGMCTLAYIDEQIPLLGRALRANPRYLTDADQVLHERGAL